MSEAPLVSFTVDETVVLLGVLRMMIDGDADASAIALAERTMRNIEDRLSTAIASRKDSHLARDGLMASD